jgi:hypothetical protein
MGLGLSEAVLRRSKDVLLILKQAGYWVWA